MLQSVKIEPSFFDQREDTLVTWLGMAGALINTRGAILLIDPLLTLLVPHDDSEMREPPKRRQMSHQNLCGAALRRLLTRRRPAHWCPNTILACKTDPRRRHQRYQGHHDAAPRGGPLHQFHPPQPGRVAAPHTRIVRRFRLREHWLIGFPEAPAMPREAECRAPPEVLQRPGG